MSQCQCAEAGDCNGLALKAGATVMPCYSPLTAYRCRGEIFFDQSKAMNYGYPETLLIPCGQCVGCRLERSRQWAVRCEKELQMHDESCFVTLTYDKDHLPPHGFLRHEDFQKFMKRLRMWISREVQKEDIRNGNNDSRLQSVPIRYYMCGEYGASGDRPHYHAILFGIDFPDRVKFKSNGQGHDLYVSDILKSLWPYGHHLIGAVTHQSIGYVARYCLKKINGKYKDYHYKTDILDPETGEYLQRPPEYARMSLRPAIGYLWYQHYRNDMRHDSVVSQGYEGRVPAYYDKLTRRLEGKEALDAIKQKRRAKALLSADNNTPERLAIREEVRLARIKSLKRSYEED